MGRYGHSGAAAAAALVAALALRLAVNAAVLAGNALPVGNDGYWHLARPASIALAGRVPDGSPQDPVEVRFFEYPVPFHLLLLSLGWATGLGTLALFRLLHLVQPLAHVLCVHALLRPSLGARRAAAGALMAALAVSTGSAHGLLFAYPSTLSLLLLLASVLALRLGSAAASSLLLLSSLQTHYAAAPVDLFVFALLALEPVMRRRALGAAAAAYLAFALLWVIPVFGPSGHLPKRQTVRAVAAAVPGLGPLIDRWFPPAAPEPAVDLGALQEREAESHPAAKLILLLNPVLMALALIGSPWREPLRLAWLPPALLFAAGLPGSYRLLLYAAQLLPLAAAPGLALVSRRRGAARAAGALALAVLFGALAETHLALSWREVYRPSDLADALVLRDALGDARVAACDPLEYAVLFLAGERPPWRVDRQSCDPPTDLLVLRPECRCRAPAPGWSLAGRVGAYAVYRRAGAG